MAINSLSTGFRPGVCTSSTRPTAPYEGQQIYETDTDLSYVWGGAAWQQVSGGTAVGNSGLVFITSATVGTGVSSVTVSNAFSAIYDSYKIVYSTAGASTAQTSMSLALGASSGAYYGTFIYAAWATGAVAGAGINNATNYTYAGGVDINAIYCNIELQNPFLAKYTSIQALTVGYSTIRGSSTGSHEAATSYSAFTLAPSTGTITGGTITVYGYRKA